MVSSSLTANTLLSLGIACMCMVTVEARAMDPNLDLHDLIRDSLDHNTNSLQDLSKGNDHTNNQSKDFMEPFTLQQLQQEVQRHRVKRLGIAGHENIDMILNHLKPSRPAISGRFRPPLSISGTFADLRSLMSKAGR